MKIDPVLKDWVYSLIGGGLVVVLTYFSSQTDYALVLGGMTYFYFLLHYKIDRFEKQCRNCGRTQK